jgi:allantoin racemase
MKIMIINPNSDGDMTAAIQETASAYVQKRYTVVTVSTPRAPSFIETYEDAFHAAPGMMQLIRDHESMYDAFILACHCDPHLDMLKEITTNPVVGIGEASMKIATMLGHSFSILSTTAHSIPQKEALVQKYGLHPFLASIRVPPADTEESYLSASRLAVEDGAEVIVLGCAGMTDFCESLQEALGIPVLDGVVCALIIAEGLVRQGISQSKARRYNPHL